MFNEARKYQQEIYLQAREFFINNPDTLINLELFIMEHISTFVEQKKMEIQRDYNEASLLYPFWQNYPPDERGRAPKGDQFPWIEVGEHVFCPKISRYMYENFYVRDTGIPTGPDDRYIISSSKIKEIIGFTDSAWVFIDIKSVGPRDDQDHTVMSHNQVSGNGKWVSEQEGVINDIITAQGKRASHPFHCAIPPIFVLSDKTIAPVVHIVIKPVYAMLSLEGKGSGQPLSRVSIATIPNGLLLTEKPNYLKMYPGLLFPGKDDKEKDPRKVRARISFELLREIASWRYIDINFSCSTQGAAAFELV